MLLESLILSSGVNSLQNLSNLLTSKILIAERIKPEAGDYVIFYNPRNDYYYVLKYPQGTRIFTRDDIVKDERERGTGQEMAYDGNTNTHKIAKNVSDLIAALVKIGKIDIKKDQLPAIFIADSVDSDLGDDIGEFYFETDRVYRGISPKDVQVSVKQVLQEKDRREKQVKKAPKKRYQVREKEVKTEDIPAMLHSLPSKADLDRIFSSSDEALQYLADITGQRILIEER